MAAPAVTVVGSVNLDLVVTVRRLPERGETVVGLSTVTGPGGKGGNQAAAAGALAPAVAMVGRVGEDSAGRRLVDDLDRRGVDTSALLVTADAPTGTATVAVEQDTGENLIIVAPGANSLLTAADVDIPAVREARVLLLQLEIPLPTVQAAVRLATGRVVLNPAPPQPLPDDLLERVDVLVPNEWELARLAGAVQAGGDHPSGPEHREPTELAALARRVTSGDVVVTMGGRGALVVTRNTQTRTDETVLVPAPATAVVDTTGAGDCFCGALCVALARGDDLVTAVRWAVVAAAVSTTAPGARGLLPDAATVDTFRP